MVEGCCAEWYILPAIRSLMLIGIMRRVLSVIFVSLMSECVGSGGYSLGC